MRLLLHNLGLGIGWALVGWVGLQASLSVWRWHRQSARLRQEYAAQRGAFRRLVETTARAARASKAIADWNGWRPFRVAAMVEEAHDVKSLYLTPVDGRPLLPFSPGQYLTFRLPISDDSPPLVRCYSLSDRPRQDYYRVTIKRIRAPAGRTDLPDGRGSSFFHERVHVDDVLDVRAPAGTFFVDPLATEPIVLLGAGIGVTPLVSMLEAIVQTGGDREVQAILGFRNSREQPFKERLSQLAQSHPKLHLHISYSAPRLEDVLYRDYSHRGRVTIERVRSVLPSNNYRFYVCGPAAMMATLVPALYEWGVPESHVHYEAFGSASISSATQSVGRFAEPWPVRFERSSRTLEWNGSCGSLLELGEGAGLALASGCRAGSCGECLTPIRSGAVTTRKRPGISVPEGHCLTCISVPMGALVLDA